MEKNLMEIIMNPIRQRIVQYLIVHGQGTTGEIKSEHEDIPPASLYRHIKLLLDAGLIEIAEEKKVRGTIEKTYKLAKSPMGDMGKEDIGTVFGTGLFSLMTSFMKYFSSENNDPVKDLLSFSTSTLMLTDEEFIEFFQKIAAIFNVVISNKPGNGRKPRRLTLISSPCEEDSADITKSNIKE